MEAVGQADKMAASPTLSMWNVLESDVLARERRLIAVFLRPYKGFWLDSPRGMQDFGV